MDVKRIYERLKKIPSDEWSQKELEFMRLISGGKYGAPASLTKEQRAEAVLFGIAHIKTRDRLVMEHRVCLADAILLLREELNGGA